jgi:cytochrome P450 family 142 subfamily A polypeptide 1
MDIDVEYLASENWDEREMHARFAWLRENDPVRWSEKDGLWLVTRFRDVAYCSKHQELFTSAEGVRPGYPAKLGLIDEDEPRHGQLRGLINKGFTPRMVKKLETVFRKITTDAIDEVAGRGECDFVDDIAVPLPLRLIAAMMGIRDEDYDRFHRWSDAMIAADGNMDDPEVVVNASTAYMEYGAYVSEIIEDRRRNPQDDLISILTGAKDQGLLREYNEDHAFRHLEDRDPSLEKDELIKLLVILMVAGNETTRNGISGGMQLLIENPAERQKLIDDPSLIRGAVEEMVRVVSPVHSFGRTVTQDTELRDRELTAGQTVLLIYPAANHDPDEFEDPDTFKVERNPHHLGFGLGSHFCMGANLARMEMRVAFEELLRRIPDMEYTAGGPEIKPSALVRTCTHMQVGFTPES